MKPAWTSSAASISRRAAMSARKWCRERSTEVPRAPASRLCALPAESRGKGRDQGRARKRSDASARSTPRAVVPSVDAARPSGGRICGKRRLAGRRGVLRAEKPAWARYDLPARGEADEHDRASGRTDALLLAGHRSALCRLSRYRLGRARARQPRALREIAARRFPGRPFLDHHLEEARQFPPRLRRLRAATHGALWTRGRSRR